MILDLGNGRELKLPDDTSDETARQLGRLILVLEDRAVASEGEVRSLRAEVDDLRREVRDRAEPAPVQAAPDFSADFAALGKKLDKLIQIGLADRIMVSDTLGVPRSRIALDRGE